MDEPAPPTERLILVSNRLPVVLEPDGESWQARPAAGGLATGLSRPHRESGGCWIGWPGIPTEEELDARLQRTLAERGMRGVALTPEEHERYYTRVCNRCIWPLFHYFTDRVHFDSGDWEVYRAVNERFARAVAEEAREGDLVFVQDFHLMLVPQLLRELRPELRIGFFLHIPFPSSEILRVFPPRDEVSRGLLGADLVAFHTLDYLRHFRSAVQRVLGLEAFTSEIPFEGRRVRLAAEALGIEADAWQRDVAEDPIFARAMGELREALNGRKLVLGVERLDYTKGIPERLRAFRDLLARDPSRVERVMMVQVAVPSRTEAEEYRDLKDEVDRLVGEVNGTFGRPGLQPLHYQFRGVDATHLNALYRMADVSLVTPLRDGLNLVAKEYVASRPDSSGVLVLSEFAGAAWELGEALHVNPFDSVAMVEALERALAMTPEEQAHRMAPMRRRIAEMDVHHWTRRCLAAIRGTRGGATPRPLDGAGRAELEGRWREARRRAVFLDYDGTLRAFTARPEDARPDAELIGKLAGLAEAPGVEAWIVSGRPPEVLAEWLGETGCGLIGEHGAWLRAPGAGAFERAQFPEPGEWQTSVRSVMEQFARRVPGSLIEEKPLGLAWHYRSADVRIGAWQARELALHLTEVCSGSGLEVLRGSKVVEVRPSGISKGTAVGALLAEGETHDLVLAAGDDMTDETLFRALPPPAITVLVGERESAARWRLPGPEDLVELVVDLVRAATPREEGQAGRFPGR